MFSKHVVGGSNPSRCTMLNGEELMISHGQTTHWRSERHTCAVCQEVERSFQEALETDPLLRDIMKQSDNERTT